MEKGATGHIKTLSAKDAKSSQSETSTKHDADVREAARKVVAQRKNLLRKLADS